MDPHIEVSPKQEKLMLHYIYSKYMQDKATRKKLYKDLKKNYQNISKKDLCKLDRKFQKFIAKKSRSSKQIPEKNSTSTQTQKIEIAAESRPTTKLQNNHSSEFKDSSQETKKMVIKLEDLANLDILQQYLKTYGTKIVQFVTELYLKGDLTPDSLSTKIVDFVREIQQSEKNTVNFEESKENLIMFHQSPNGNVSAQDSANLPKGIQNIGHTCYSSCILQILYHFPQFVKKICKFRQDDAKRSELMTRIESLGVNDKHRHKLQLVVNGGRFIQSLQELFRELTVGHADRASPSKVFGHMIAGDGRKMFQVGVQEDVVEFMDCFFQLITAGYELHEQVGHNG